MTKGEQARLVAWRLRVLRAATEAGATTACRHVGLSRKTFTSGRLGSRRTGGRVVRSAPQAAPVPARHTAGGRE